MKITINGRTDDVIMILTLMFTGLVFYICRVLLVIGLLITCAITGGTYSTAAFAVVAGYLLADSITQGIKIKQTLDKLS